MKLKLNLLEKKKPKNNGESFIRCLTQIYAAIKLVVGLTEGGGGDLKGTNNFPIRPQ